MATEPWSWLRACQRNEVRKKKFIDNSNLYIIIIEKNSYVVAWFFHTLTVTALDTYHIVYLIFIIFFFIKHFSCFSLYLLLDIFSRIYLIIQKWKFKTNQNSQLLYTMLKIKKFLCYILLYIISFFVKSSIYLLAKEIWSV